MLLAHDLAHLGRRELDLVRGNPEEGLTMEYLLAMAESHQEVYGYENESAEVVLLL